MSGTKCVWVFKLLGGVWLAPVGNLRRPLPLAWPFTNPPHHDHSPRPERKRALVLRLKTHRGQLRGIQRLIESGEGAKSGPAMAAPQGVSKSFYTLVGCVIAQGDVPAGRWADMPGRSKFA